MAKNSTTKEAKALPTWGEQLALTEQEMQGIRDLLPQIEKLLPPSGAALGSPEMNNAPVSKWRTAFATLTSVFNRLTGNSAKNKGTPAALAEKDRKAIVDALRTILNAVQSYDQHIAQMGDNVGLASLSKLPEAERSKIAAQINAALAKTTQGEAA